MLEPEQAWPSTNLMPLATMRLATDTACLGSQTSSSIESLIWRPHDAALGVDRGGGGLRRPA